MEINKVNLQSKPYRYTNQKPYAADEVRLPLFETVRTTSTRNTGGKMTVTNLNSL